MQNFTKIWMLAAIAMLAVTAGGCNGSRRDAINLGETSTHRGFITKTLVNEGRTRQYCVFLPMNYTPTHKWPAIMFLHGVGESGSDLQGPMCVGIAPFVADRKDDFPFIVIIPQSSGGWDANSDSARDAIAALLQAEKDYAIDPDRVSLTGLSTGGYGTFAIGAKYSYLFAAIAPMCPSGADTSDGETLGHMNIWAFENAADPFVAPMSMALTLGSIKNSGGTLKHTIYPMVGHDCWETAYRDGELFDWLQQQHRPGAIASAMAIPAAAPIAKPAAQPVMHPAYAAPAPRPAASAAPMPRQESVAPAYAPGRVPATPY